MRWLKPILIATAVLLAVAAALPFLISLEAYIPRLENEVSARLKEPVSIKSLRLVALPLPHLAVEGIAVGKAGDLRVGKVLVIPDFYSLLQSNRVVKRIEIEALVLSQKAIERIPAWSRPESGGSPQSAPQFRVESIRLNDAVVNLGAASFGPFDARINLDGRGEPGDASMTTRDGKLKLFITPDQSRYRIELSAKSWTLPVGPQFLLDELIVKGVATLNDARFGEVNARLYGGTVHGKAAASWQKGLRLSGNLDVSQVEMQKLAAMLSSRTRVSGRLSATPAWSASAASADQLLNALRLETPFTVHHGVLHGVDIQQAAAGLLKRGATGGETRFDQLSGHLVVAHGGYRFTQLKVASGALAVDGSLNVSPKKELSGRINARLKAAGSSANVPLNVAGTVDAPMLYPTVGSMAGAAAGTVLLGPGMGTSLGAKLGGWAENLFGKKDEKKPRK